MKSRQPLPRPCTAWLALACLALIGSLHPLLPGEDRRGLSAADVRQALERGKEALSRNLRQYRRVQQEVGYRVLAAMALLNCGVSPDDAAVAETLTDVCRTADLVTKEEYSGTYRAGVILMLLAMTKDPKYHPIASNMSRRLQLHQSPNGGWGDYSRTQFALLGLKAAEDLGVEVPESVFQKARRYVESGQNADGGWGYQPGDTRQSYGSMTVAGLSSLYICGSRLYRSTAKCGHGESDKRLVKGLEWLAKNFSVRTNPGGGGQSYYYLYGLERVGILMAQRTIGGHDWYREGAEYLVRAQDATGAWPFDMLGTEFAMLFLGKGSHPVAIQKLRYGTDWNPDPYDAKELTEQASKDLELPMTYQIVDATAKAEELAGAPILYLKGHKEFKFDEDFRRAFKAFVDHGGFVFASACCGAKDFDKSFRTEMKRIFPDAAFEVLAPEHPVYTARHRIAKQEAFMLEGLNTGCRTSILYAPHDLCCGWGGCKGCEDKGGVPGVEARQVGVNMIAYALNFQRLRDKLDKVEVNAKPADLNVPRGTLVIGQLYHGGEWDPDPASIPNLTQTLREQAGIKAGVAKRRVVLGVDDPGDFPLLYLTGHKNFQFTETQVTTLRGYLDRGGFLMADACCGKAEFDAGFRRLCAQLYPGQALERLPKSHALFAAPFKIERVQYKVMVKRLFPELGDEPHLEGITSKGRLALVYSRINFGCELQGHTCNSCLGLKAQDAYQIAVNIVLYALSH